MRLLTFERDGGARLGVRKGGEVVDLAAGDPALPGDLAELARGDGGPVRAGGATAAAPAGARLRHAELSLLPPVTRPGKVVCLGLNYVDQAAEGGFEKPDHPVVFMRGTTSLIGHGRPPVRPACSETMDYEGELVVVIGRPGRHVSRDDALDHVAGYSIFNDASVRACQRRTHQWTIGKNFDATGAFGPEFVTADELPPGAAGLSIRTRLKGMVVQNADTADMIFDVAETIGNLTEVMTLETGDVLVMGTPAGVGYARQPPLWMKHGDVCEVEIEGIGVLRNLVRDEAEAGAA